MENQLSRAANDLVRAIFDSPTIDRDSTVEVRQAYRNGYYSVRDLPEFQRLVELLKAEGVRV